MSIKSPQSLVQEALKQVKTISPEEALEKSKNNQCNLIDIRDALELQNEGAIENALHISRGLLEFSIHNGLETDKEIILFCAAGGRSALATKTLKEMGYKKVCHIQGGFSALQNSKFKIKK